MQIFDELLVNHRDLTLPHRDSAKVSTIQRQFLAVRSDQPGNGVLLLTLVSPDIPKLNPAMEIVCVILWSKVR